MGSSHIRGNGPRSVVTSCPTLARMLVPVLVFLSASGSANDVMHGTGHQPSDETPEVSKHSLVLSRSASLRDTLRFRLMDYSSEDLTDILDSIDELVELFTNDCTEQKSHRRAYDIDEALGTLEHLRTDLERSGLTEKRAARIVHFLSRALLLALRHTGVCSDTFQAVYRAMTT